MKQRGFLGMVLLLIIAAGVGFAVYTWTYTGEQKPQTAETATTTDPFAHLVATSSQAAVTPSLPRAGGTPTVQQTSPNVPASVQSIKIISPNGGEMLQVGSTHLIQWSIVSNIVTGTNHQVRIEAVPSRIDRGPILIALYNAAPNILPKSIPWTVPLTMDINDSYRIRITYANSSRIYADSSDYLITIRHTMSQEPIRITTHSAAVQTVNEGAKNIPLVTFMVQTPLGSDALITELALGSENENSLFNSVENMKLAINGQKISDLMYDNQFLGATPLYKLTHPILVPKDTNMLITITADLKPGVDNMKLPGITLTGGRGNYIVEGTVTGGTITVR